MLDGRAPQPVTPLSSTRARQSPRRRGRHVASLLSATCILVLASACATSPSLAPDPTPSTEPIPLSVGAPDPIEKFTLAERVGQLLMVGTPVATIDPRTASAVSDLHVGGVFLHGRSQEASSAIAGRVAALQALVGDDLPALLVATDQEGGLVQVLSGNGFEPIPSAEEQVALGPSELRIAAQRWGDQLRAAGVTMNLAPVADLVPGPFVRNPPIGDLDRSYGFDAVTVVDHASAFAAGMRAAGVIPVLKHFPGLGYTTQNTDFSANVIDRTTTATGEAVAVFRQTAESGDPAIMMSLATYALLDETAPAVFSPVLVTTVLRTQLEFDGVIMTDDMSATAQVRRWTPGERAVLAVAAGVDLVLASADPGVAAEMHAALLARANADPAFAARVTESAKRVLALKATLPPAN